MCERLPVWLLCNLLLMLLVVLAGRAKNKKGSYVSLKCVPPLPRPLPSPSCVSPSKGAPAGVLFSVSELHYNPS